MSNHLIKGNSDLEKMWKEEVMAYFKMLSNNLHSRSVENNETDPSVHLMYQPSG
jgi:hypothetical protein